MLESITKEISVLRASENPLSADVVFIRMADCTWIFDAGSNDNSFALIDSEKAPKKIVLSHFHPDHSANVRRIFFNDASSGCTYGTELYAGANTAKYFPMAKIVDAEIHFGDVVLYPVPNCHAKGSLVFKYKDYAFLGDSAYVTEKGGKRCYNYQLLLEEIKFLKSLDVKYFCLSHDRKFVRSKESVILMLEHIKTKRIGNDAYIWM